MQIDIPAHIEKQLFLRDAIIIPGLGGFTATPTASTVDYVGGSVTPPGKTLTFSENLTTDDGILIQDIAQTHGISTEEARHVVDEFTEKTQQLLNQREIVTLPRIGRLYKNYVQRIQFLPDAANFNAESYGLPPLQFSPIARSREVSNPPVASEAVSNPSSSSSSVVQTPVPAPVALPNTVTAEYEPESRSSANWATFLAVFLLLGAGGMGIWYWQQQKAKRLTNANQTEQPVESTEKSDKPVRKSKPTASEETVVTDITAPPDEPSPEAVAAAEKRMQAAREAIEKTAVDGRECVLVVATLQDRNNADRLVQKLKKEGHQVYFFQKSGFQVGIQFRYHNLSEVQDKIVALQTLTGEQNIWIKKK